MLRQIKILTGVQLLGLWNINEALHSKDLSKKRRLLFLLAVWVLVAGLLFFMQSLCPQPASAWGRPG